MSARAIFVDSFSGCAADLPKGKRTPADVLEALKRDPSVSVWDMGEHAWLRNAIGDLIERGAVVSDPSEPYPWCRYEVVAQKVGA